MRHYVAIFVEDHMGEWRVVFPDAPGCDAKAFNLHDAQYVAATALMQFLNRVVLFRAPHGGELQQTRLSSRRREFAAVEFSVAGKSTTSPHHPKQRCPKFQNHRRVDIREMNEAPCNRPL